MITENLETKILEILYNHFQSYPGYPEILFSELAALSGAKPEQIQRTVFMLRKK